MKSHLPIALALVAGVCGGLLSRYIAPPTAYAQNKTPAAEIRALSFVLVDSADRLVGAFTTEPSLGRPGPASRIVLRDSSGHVIWRAGGVGIQPVTER